MDTILHVRDLQYSYNGRTVLAIPELEVSRASIIGLAGPNGSGKTTLLKLLSCVVKPTTGSVSFHDAIALPEDRPIRHKICLLPQESYTSKWQKSPIIDNDDNSSFELDSLLHCRMKETHR